MDKENISQNCDFFDVHCHVYVGGSVQPNNSSDMEELKMNQTIKKFISTLLLIGTLLSITPMSVNAAQTTDSTIGSSSYSEWTEKSGNWYYYENNKALKGWQEIDGYWFYFNTTGILQKGWLEIDGTWFYLDELWGYMHTGWQEVDGKWYYLDETWGYMHTGWLQVGSKWYYLDETWGYMHTGWMQDGSTWYYFKSDGSMASNESLNISGTRYSFASSGAMRKNAPKSSSTSSSTQVSYTVYVSRYGKIHKRSNCSGMKYYTAMSYSDAINAGYSKCKNCY